LKSLPVCSLKKISCSENELIDFNCSDINFPLFLFNLIQLPLM